jgi:hypothetical protein
MVVLVLATYYFIDSIFIISPDLDQILHFRINELIKWFEEHSELENFNGI